MVGYLGISWMTYRDYKILMKEDLEKISQLAASNIYNNIDNELTKPLYVVKTLAQDQLLKEMIQVNEKVSAEQEEKFDEEIVAFLKHYKEVYQYSKVFYISDKSGKYYYEGGVSKVISHEDTYDQWYYRFINSGKQISLDINMDEDNQITTIFINSRLEASDGRLLGVIGVAMQMQDVQKMIQESVGEADVQAGLTNAQGEILVDLNTDQSGSRNIFDTAELDNVRADILENKDGQLVFWYPGEGYKICITTEYIQEMEWYLVVCKNNIKELRSFRTIMFHNFCVNTAIAVLLIVIIVLLIRRHNQAMFKVATMDSLTRLPNRRYFYEVILKKVMEENSQKVVFMFDIDDFKHINDTAGHLAGDAVITQVAEVVSNTIGKENLLARWGGDEFCGIIYDNGACADQMMEEFRQKISDMKIREDGSVSISIGYVVVNRIENIDDMISMADRALYISKSKGKNQITKYKE